MARFDNLDGIESAVVLIDQSVLSLLVVAVFIPLLGSVSNKKDKTA